MAVSLEVRCPILDHVFMEYAARIPSTLKLVGREGKYLLKKALEPYLPREILYRPKMGFGMPILEWLKTDLHAYARALVLMARPRSGIWTALRSKPSAGASNRSE